MMAGFENKRLVRAGRVAGRGGNFRRLWPDSWMIPVAAAMLLLGSCATIRTPSGDLLRRNSPDFREYAGDVFRRHNAALVSLFDATEFASDEELPELDRAEQHMLERCADLNDAASANRDGKSLGISKLKRIASTVVACDNATLEAENLIRRVEASAPQAKRQI